MVAAGLAAMDGKAPGRLLRTDPVVITAKLAEGTTRCAETGIFRISVAERTGLEPATPGVTGRYSNQLNYRSAL